MPLNTWADMLASAETESKSFDPLPDGTYDFFIEKAEHRTSAKGKDGYSITAVVENGPYKNRKVFNDFWISPDSPTALSIFFRQMRELGLNNDFWVAGPSKEQIVAGLTGKRFQGTVNTEEYQGKKKNRLQGVSKARGEAPAAPNADVPSVESSIAAQPTAAPAAPPATPSAPAGSPWENASQPTSSGVPSFGGAPESPF